MRTRLMGSQNFGSGKAENQVTLASVFAAFFRVGLFTFGGGLAMMSVIRHELVLKRRWIEDGDFISFMSLATAIPGVIAVSTAYLLGRRLRGKAGSAAAMLGTVLPSFLVILLIAVFFLPFFDHPAVSAFFRGCAIAIVGQLAFTGFIFSRKLLPGWRHAAVCAVGLIAVGVLKLHPIWGIVAAGTAGYWFCPEMNSQGTP